MQNSKQQRPQQTWTVQEKLQLCEFIKKSENDPKRSWVQCSQMIGTKSPRQCYDAYVLGLYDPMVQRPNHKWTHEEEERLLLLAGQGKPWSFVQKHFDYLTTSQLKNKYKALKKPHLTNLTPESGSSQHIVGNYTDQKPSNQNNAAISVTIPGNLDVIQTNVYSALPVSSTIQTNHSSSAHLPPYVYYQGNNTQQSANSFIYPTLPFSNLKETTPMQNITQYDNTQQHLLDILTSLLQKKDS